MTPRHSIKSRWIRYGIGASLAMLAVGFFVATWMTQRGRADARRQRSAAAKEAIRSGKIVPVKKSDAAWLRQLGMARYHILRRKGTERPWSGEYNKHYAKGTYTCAGCGLPLFRSADKFDSGTGWPSFKRSHSAGHVREVADRSHGMVRTEVLCNRCGGHLGHVFDDGPKPTGLRYCINSLALRFKAAAKVRPRQR